MSEIESSAEKRFGERLSRWSYEMGFNVTYLKLSVLGQRGWPDRLLLWPDREVMFIEWKADNEEPRKLQDYIHGILRSMGFDVRVYVDDVVALEEVKHHIQATISSPYKG